MVVVAPLPMLPPRAKPSPHVVRDHSRANGARRQCADAGADRTLPHRAGRAERAHPARTRRAAAREGQAPVVAAGARPRPRVPAHVGSTGRADARGRGEVPGARAAGRHRRFVAQGGGRAGRARHLDAARHQPQGEPEQEADRDARGRRACARDRQPGAAAALDREAARALRHRCAGHLAARHARAAHRAARQPRRARRGDRRVRRRDRDGRQLPPARAGVRRHPAPQRAGARVRERDRRRAL